MNTGALNSKKNKKIIGNYLIEKTIGEGTFGKVKLGIHLLTEESVAIKILEKDKIQDKEDLQRVAREIKFLKKLSHQNIIRTYEVVENSKYFYIITEYANSGELYNEIVKKRHLEEYEASNYYVQLISALDYIHKNNIVHRDIKPENLLLKENNVLILIDFGLSNQYNQGQMLQTPCGSPCYAAPEMILGRRYNPMLVDVWSSGIVLYAMVCGYLPFEGKNNDVLYRKVLEGKYELPDRLSINCKDLIRKILVTNPQKRITLEEIKHHPFIQSAFSAYHIESNSFDKKNLCEAVIEKMKTMNFTMKEIVQNLELRKYNNTTATYFLLLKKYLTNNEVFKTFTSTSQQSLSLNTTSQTGPMQSANKVEIVVDKEKEKNNNNQDNDHEHKHDKEDDSNSNSNAIKEIPIAFDSIGKDKDKEKKSQQLEDKSPRKKEIINRPTQQLGGDMEQDEGNHLTVSPKPEEIKPTYKSITKKPIANNTSRQQRQNKHQPITNNPHNNKNNQSKRASSNSQAASFREKNYYSRQTNTTKNNIDTFNSDNRTSDANENSMSLDIAHIVNQNKFDSNIIPIAPKLVPIKRDIIAKFHKQHESTYYSSLAKKSQENSPTKGMNRVIDTSVTYDRGTFQCDSMTLKSKKKQMLYVPSNTINLMDPCNDVGSSSSLSSTMTKKTPNCTSFNKGKSLKKSGELSGGVSNPSQCKRSQSENEKSQNKTTRTSATANNNSNNKYLWTYSNEYKEEGRKNNFDLINGGDNCNSNSGGNNNNANQRKDSKSFEKNYQGTNANEPNLKNSTGYNFHKAVYDLRKKFKTLSIIDTSKITNQSILCNNNANANSNANPTHANGNNIAVPNTNANGNGNTNANSNRRKATTEIRNSPQLNKKSKQEKRVTMHTGYCPSFTENNNPKQSNKIFSTTGMTNTLKDPHTNFENINVVPKKKTSDASIKEINSTLLDNRPVSPQNFLTQKNNPKSLHNPHRIHHPALKKKPTIVDIDITEQQKHQNLQQQTSASNSQKNIKLTTSKPKTAKNHQTMPKKTCLKINISGNVDIKNPDTPKTDKTNKPSSSLKNNPKLNTSSNSNSQSSSSYRVGNVGNSIKKKPIQKQIEEDIPTKNKIISSSNDFALCTTNSTMKEIRNKLTTLSKELQLTLTEIDSSKFICKKNTNNSINIEISKVGDNNVLKLYHLNGQESITKEMIKMIIITIGF